MGLFFKKKSISLAIISSLFILILIFFISFEFYIEGGLFGLNSTIAYLFLTYTIFLYLLPILIFQFFNLINQTKKIIKYFFYFFSSIYYILLLFLVLYLGRSRLIFDAYFFMYNLDEVIPATIGTIGIHNFFSIIFLFVFLVFSMIVFFENIKPLKLENKKSKIFRFLILIIILCFCLIMGVNMKNRNPVIIKFFNRIFATNNEFIKDYNQKYKNIFDYYSSINLDNFVFDKNMELDRPDIYFIHLESINNELVSKKITPELLKYSDEYGIRFTNFFSNTVQTLRAEESILCAMPPSLNRYLNYTHNTEGLMCLPEIFDNLGYQTMFFKSHDLDYTWTGDFMKKIGFSEVHNGDIMKEEDEKLVWGYKEDDFYNRVLEYLDNNKAENNFIYIAVSSTNHYPFDVDHFDGHLPFDVEERTTKENFVQKLANSVYIQDNYFGKLMDKLVNNEKKKYIFIYSDNAWPVGIHENNIFNEALAYKENFSIPLTFISIGDDNFKKSEIVKDYYSQIDIFNTTLDLFDISSEKKYLGNSFYNQLIEDDEVENNNLDTCILNIQPFSDKFFSFFKNNIHYIYNVYTKEFIYYDLLNDTNESNPNISSDFETLYNDCTDFSKIMN